MMKLILIFFFSVLAFTGCTNRQPVNVEVTSLPYYTSADFTPHWYEKNSKEIEQLHFINAFSFTDQLGSEVSDKTFANKIYVANFFFTSCPGICKQLTSGMHKVQEAFMNDTDVLLLSHSVTPEKDSVPVLKNYAERNDVRYGKWFLVTGDQSEIYKIARQSYFADEDLGLQKDADDFLHTENIILIDKQKKIRGIYKGTSTEDIDNLIADIKVLQKEK